ncbi:uncharacterized protein [Dermacentor andersoni]|uniref:uncharacterized protein n=1 Tax=Dermacentor andersoni TaxID=34620 RepID=UPI002415E9A3|nr:uncharacterized protein LOC129382930 [Dermacentor andersoni]
MENEANCYAAPPTVFTSPMRRFPSLETHWPLIRSNATYTRGTTLVGVSFEMGTMIYVLEKDAPDLNGSAYAKCTSVGMTSRDAICGRRKSVSQEQQFLQEPYIIYGTFITESTKRHVAFADYYTSARNKVALALTKLGSLPRRAALMLFNVHLGDVKKRCGADAFTLIKWICQEFKGTRRCN